MQASSTRFGESKYGQLGLGHLLNVNMPRQVAIEAVRSVCAGGAHTAAITREGGLFTWGCNGDGTSLGHVDSTHRYIPTAVASIAHLTVKHVTAGLTCTLVIDAGGSIWMAGRMRSMWVAPKSDDKVG